jgi:apolipoprotein N-acyltransferase
MLEAQPGSTARRRVSRSAQLLAVLAAFAFALSFPLSASFVHGWPFAFVWPALFAAAVARTNGLRELIVVVAPPFFCAFLAHEWWMHTVTQLGMPVLVLYLTAWTVVVAWVVRCMGCGGHDQSGSGADAENPRRLPWSLPWSLPWIIVLPLALVAIEFLRGDFVCTGYAWFFTAHPLVEWREVAQIASLGGGWLLTAFAGVIAGGVLDGCTASRRVRVVSPTVAALTLAAAWIFGAARVAEFDRIASRADTPDDSYVLLVQTNVPMSNKLAWSPEGQVEDFVASALLTIEEASRAKAAGKRVVVAVWPETMVPGFGFEPESLATLTRGQYFPGDRFAEGLADLSRRINAPIIAGSAAYEGLRVEDARFRWDQQFNSAYLVDSTGPLARTDKIYLTPFGETMPIISRSDWLEAQLLALGAEGMTFDLESAEEPRILRLSPEPTAGGTSAGNVSPAATPANTPGQTALSVGVPICFEITMPWASRRIAFDGGERQAEVLVNISNDGWFGSSRLGRRQHLQVAQLRAIELDTAVLRSVNTGVSAWIDRTGRVRASEPAEEAGAVLARVERSSGTPLAARLGDSVAWCAVGACVILCALRNRPFVTRLSVAKN